MASICSLLLLCTMIWGVDVISNYPVVLVVSMDAFRPDYVEDCLTPNIVKLRTMGVYAPFMKNVFPTKTFPNHHSIATGVHPELHGVLDSTVYSSKDGCCNRTLLGYSYELYHYSDEFLPIWTLNQLAGKGRHSGVMMWPGGEFPYGCKKTLPAFFQKLNISVSYEDRIDIAMSWILHEVTPVNLVMLYLEEPDFHAHAFGFDSVEVRDQIKKLDKALGYMVQQFQKHNLSELVTVFVVSDHGMININQKNIIDLSSYVNKSLYTSAGYSPVLQVFPNEGHEEYVLSSLQRASQQYHNKFDVYTRNEIPRKWHYASNNRTPPILVVAKEGFAFQDFYKNIDDLNRRFNIEPSPHNRYGIHGYSNTISTMHPFFFAWGPLVKSDLVLDPFNTTELFPLWAYILNLDLEPDVYSSPNFSMLRSNSVLSQRKLPSLQKPSDKPLNRTSFASFRAHFPKSAPPWTIWCFVAVTLLIVIAGVVAHFFRDLQRTGAATIIPPANRNIVENQHLLVSDSEDEFKL